MKRSQFNYEAEDRLWLQRVTRKGKLNFILVRGGLIWGLPLGLLWNLMDLIRSPPLHVSSELLFQQLLILAAFYGGGCLLGAYHWHRYQKEVLTQSKNTTSKK